MIQPGRLRFLPKPQAAFVHCSSLYTVDLTLRVRIPHAEREVYGSAAKLRHYLELPCRVQI